MEEHTPRADPEVLLAQRSWVKRVARALVRDGSRAEDLEQSVWLRALERPRPVRSPRAWLGTALRNAASDLFRGEGRRRRREEAAARPEAAPAADEAVARAEALRRAVDAALALREPYRTVVVLRFFEDLSPPEIARRQGLPLETVRTRLRRALGMLRERLDADHGGDRRAWLALLLPLAGRGPFPGLPGAPAAPAEPGAWSGADAASRAADAAWREGLIMTAKAAFAAGLATAFAVGAAFWLLQGMEPPAAAPEPHASSSPPAVAAFPAAGGWAPNVEKVGDAQEWVQVPYVGSSGAPNRPGETPRSDYVITRPAEQPERLATFDRERRLRDLAAETEEVRRRLTDLQSSAQASALEEAPAGAPCILGTVVDEEGRPVVTGGRIKILPAGPTAEGGPGMTSFHLPAPRHEFRSPALAAGHRYEVTARYFAGYLGARATGVEPDGRSPVRLVLRRGGAIEGRVVEEDGTPVRGRVVVVARAEPAPVNDASFLGGDSGTTVVRPDGTFRLEALGEFPFRLRVTGEDYLDGPDRGTVRAGDRVDLRVERGVALLGRVGGWAPDDARRFVLYARQDGGIHRLATVSPSGALQVRAHRPGVVHLEVAPAGNPASRHPLGAFTAPASDIEVRIPEEARSEAATDR